MQKFRDRLIFSPSDLCRFIESPFVTWMDRVHLELPGRYKPDSDSDTNKLLQDRGIEHERAFVSQLEQRGLDVCDVSHADDRAEATIEAMRTGREVIYQAALRHEPFIGYADFLIKVDGQSEFGSHHYEPWDTKLGLHAKPYYLIQLACYADLLSQLQKRLARNVYLVLGNNETKALRTEDFLYHYLQIRRAFLDQQAAFDPNVPPKFSGLEDFGRWTSEAERHMNDLDHLCRVANIRRSQIRKLHKCGVMTMTDLASYQSDVAPGMEEATLATLRQQARLQLESNGLPEPKFELIDSGNGKGLLNLPPFSPMDIYFDMEGYPFSQGGLEYLFGSITIENGEEVFTDLWAHTAEQERKAFEDFIDWAHSRWLADQSMHIYHFASYEKSALRRLMGTYSTRENELDELLRNEAFVDLFGIVRQSIRAGFPNYSIKSIEQLYRSKRQGNVATALDSVVFYNRWLNQQDGDTWETSGILAEIRSYNRDDCVSTYQLANWLRDLQKNNGIVYQDKVIKSAPESGAAQVRSNAAALAHRMHSDIPADIHERNDKQNVQGLLAHLLEFHWREAKPVFWSKYDRYAMTDMELFEDTSCLAGLRRTPTRQQLNSTYRSILYEYEYDPDQDTKIDVGDSCFYSHDLTETVTIESIDSESGRITIKRSRDKAAPPAALSLILDEFVDASALAESIYRIAESFLNGKELPKALEDLLLRRAPRLGDWTGGALVADAEDLVEGTINIVARMDHTTLCIQGPPGSGKTYTAARAIAHLVKAGKQVGVTSNSHKAIAKLLDEVAKLLDDDKVAKIAKVQSNPADFEATNKRIYKIEPTFFFEKGRGLFSVVGGTAWLFSDQRADDVCDYLFVDEAGQVSLANLVAMSRSSSSIVLIGDQMQLAQPLKGSHPGESGKSALEYLLCDQEVVSDDFGIFLSTTRRLHPELCSFISGAIYQDRLAPHPDTFERSLELASSESNHITKAAGLVFISVEHHGNVQDSEEEAAVIVKVVDELMRGSWKDKGLVRPIEAADILLVAPYNMQVRRLRKCLPAFQVGSVDKFQGQEAPIAIVSMCASSGEGLSRGAEFLFSKNRLNVAISRAQALAIVVGSPALADIRCTTVEQMELVNLYCRIMQIGAHS